MCKIFCMFGNIKRYFCNYIQNILTINWRIWCLNNIEFLRALRFKSTYMFLNPHPFCSRDCFKNTYELLNLRVLKFPGVCVRYVVWCGISNGTFEIPHKISYPYIENILPIHWRIWCLYNIECWRGLIFKSSYMFLNASQLMQIRIIDLVTSCSGDCLVPYWHQAITRISDD